jgi:protein arginine N-methyltransferase 1
VEYTISDYGSMIADTGRMDAYAAALERVVTPGAVVVDIGTGTGIAALLACRLGARRVFAIEPSPVIELARQAARDNGFADRIEFFEDSSTRVTLPELADVVVADLRGLLPLHTVHLTVLEDARCRLLKPGGTLIPQRDRLWGAPVEAPKDLAAMLDVWRVDARGFDLEAARTHVANSFWKTERVTTADLLGEPQLVATLEYAAGTAGTDLTSLLSFAAKRDGALQGLLVWFDAELAEGIGFSNAPGSPDLIYGRALFPLPESVPLSEGEEITVMFAANLVAGEYVFRWNVSVGVPTRPRVRFHQSTFAGMPLSARTLHAMAETFTPELDEEGTRVLKALQLMDGRRTVAEIATALESEGFPHGEALGLATTLVQKYAAQSG